MVRVAVVFALSACHPGGEEPTTGESGAATTVPLDPDVPPVTAGAWARLDARATWHVQLVGALDLSQPDVDVSIVDLFAVDPVPAVDPLVFCRIVAGAWEPARDDAAAFPVAARGEPVADQPGAAWLDVRSGAVQQAMAARLDRAVAAGCDGVALARVDGHAQSTGFPLTERDQLAFDRFLANGAHERGLSVLLSGARGLVGELAAYVDGWHVESCVATGDCADGAPFLTTDRPVFDAEYDVADPAAMCRAALQAQVRAVILPPALDGSLRIACDTDFPSATRLADAETYATYYGRDAAAIGALSAVDLAIVQPWLTADQRAAAQSRATLAVYLSIGEIGLSNTYFVDGAAVPGQVIFDAHPEWFLAQNPAFDSWFADASQAGWREFVLGQADALLAQGYDGLFLDTVDTVDLYPQTAAGMVTLIEALRAAHPDAAIVQNRGMAVLPETGDAVDALMFEIFSSYWDAGAGAYLPTDPAAPGYAEIVARALDYRLAGGVVLAQDSAVPGLDELICADRDRALGHLFLPSFADYGYQGGPYAFPAACPWPEEPRIGLAFAPGVVHLRRSGAAPWTVSLAGEAGFADPVTVTIDAPAGLTIDGAFPAFTVHAAADAPIGRSALTVVASGGGQSRTYAVAGIVHEQTVWVTNAGLSNVVAFDEGELAVSPALPSRRTSALVAQPYAIAVAADGAQWVAENVGDPAAPQPAGRILRYAPFDLAAPDLTVAASLSYPTDVALAADGTVWVVNSALDWSGAPRGAPSLATVDPVTAVATEAFSFPSASYGYPRSLAFDAAGDLWVTTTWGLVVGYAAPIAAASSPFAVLLGIGGAGGDAFDALYDLTFDGAGNLWASGSLAGGSRVVQIPAGSWAVDGSTTVLGPSELGALLAAGLYDPWGVAIDAAGALWVVNATDALGGAGSLLRFSAPTIAGAADLAVPLESRYPLGVAVASP